MTSFTKRPDLSLRRFKVMSLDAQRFFQHPELALKEGCITAMTLFFENALA